MTTGEQVARRFWPPVKTTWVVRRRLGRLVAIGLLREQAQGRLEGPKVWLATSKGLRLAGMPVKAARFVSWRLAHDLALVDLSEALLAEHEGSSWLTERELRTGGWRTSLGFSRLPDGLLILADGRRFAVELEASRKEAERIRRIVDEYMLAFRGGNPLAGVLWYVRPGLSVSAEHLRTAVESQGLSWAFEVRSWQGRP